MAYKPSRRSSQSFEEVEIMMTPIMNLMVVLIPLLLSSATYVKIGVIELNLPPAVGTTVTQSKAPKETDKKLDLAVTITDQGYFISSSMTVVKGKENNAPSIGLKEDGTHNYEELSKKLLEIKKEASEEFSDTDKIVIQAEPEINYQLLVATMDATRNIIIDSQKIPLFPDVSLAAGVI